MSSIEKVIEKFPEELRLPMYEAISIAIEESRNIVLKHDIEKVWEAIKDLAEAQKRAEERLTKLEEKMVELAEAQKKTEQRLNELAEAQKRTEERVNELAEAQKKTEERLTKLEEKMVELAEAQKKTEQRLNELAEAQKKTEQRLNELAEAQKKTEEALLKLIEEHKETRRQLGGLQGTVGYTLENESYKHLPFLLKRDHRIEVKERLKRKYIKDKYGQMVEVNIFGYGNINGEEVTIIGEAKSQLSKNEVNRFLKRIKEFEGVYKKIIPVIVTHMTTSYDVEDYAKGKGIILYYSYDF